MARHGRGRAFPRVGALLGVAALLLQATALLAHHLGSPHTHGAIARWTADATARLGSPHPAADHDSGADHETPAQDLPPCPVWTALQTLGGFVAPVQAAPAVGRADHDSHAAHGGPAPGPAIIMFVPSPPYDARIDVAPARLGPTTITARLYRADGSPLDAAEARLSLALPEAGIEPLTRRMSRQGAGVFMHTRAELSLPGTWRLRIEALVSDFEKAVFEKEMEFP